MRDFNTNFIIEKNKRTPDGPTPINLVTFYFADPVYLSDRDITPSWGPDHQGIIKEWDFIDSQVAITPGGTLLGKIEICDFSMTLINMEDPPFSDKFSDEVPPESCIVEVYQWFAGLNYQDRDLIFKGTVYGAPVYSLYECKLTIRGVFQKHNKLIGEGLIVRRADYPDADPDDVGKMLALAWGPCEKVPFRGIEVGAVTTLAEDVDEAETTFEVTDTDMFDAPGTALIENEKISYTGAGNNQLTGITRGAFGSTATAHAPGSKIRELLSKIVYVVGCPVKSIDTVYVKNQVTGLYLRQVNNYNAYTGQSGDEHSTYTGKGVIEFVGKIPIPLGAIVPFNDTDLPDGWAWFAEANGKMIVGAGDTYAIGEAGGDDAVSTATDNHSHQGGSDVFWCPEAGGTPIHTSLGITANAPFWREHTHTVSFDYLPEYQDLKFIKAVSDRDYFPANAIVLTPTDVNPYPEKLSIAIENDKFLRANSSKATGGGNQSNVTVSTDGAHNHETIADAGGDYYSLNEYLDQVGAHTHSTTLTSFSATQNIKRAYLRAWTANASFQRKDNMIIMWESLNPPDGWLVCDGDNATPDLRDFFIVLSSSANAGTLCGDNIVDFDYGLADGGAHDHKGAYLEDKFVSHEEARRSPEDEHTHTEDGSSTNYTPPYYALIFIMKAPINTAIQGNQVTADISGQQDEPEGTYTGTPNALITRCDHVFKHIWGGILGAPLADIDSATFAAAATFFNTNNYAFSYAITEPIRADELFMKLALQCRSRFFVTPYGTAKLMVRQLNQASGHSIVKNEIRRDSIYIERSSPADIINYFNISYNLEFNKDKNMQNCLAVKEFKDDDSITKYGQKEPVNPDIFLFDAVSLDAMVQHVGAFYLVFQKEVRKIPQFEVFLDNMEVEQGDIIDITHPLDNMQGFTCEVIKIQHILGSGKNKRIDRVKIIAIEN